VSARLTLDSFALLAYLQDEPGGALVQELLAQARDRQVALFSSWVNAAEVYWTTRRRHGASVAETAWITLLQLPIAWLPVDERIARVAGEIKARYAVALGDAFAAATARVEEAEVLTGDREFALLEGFVPVRWLGERPSR
jgi:ribonuclease VapC